MSFATAMCRKCAMKLSSHIDNNLRYMQVRFRKPMWLPPNKSKLFYVPEKHKQDPEEYEKLKTMYQIYRCEMHSIRAYLKERYVDVHKTEQNEEGRAEEGDELSEEVIRWMDDENTMWNSEIAVAREERQRLETLEQEKDLTRKLEYEEKRRNRLRRIAESKVKEELEYARSHITYDSLDDHVERLLNSRVDYNFAITRYGKVFDPDAKELEDRTSQNSDDTVTPSSDSGFDDKEISAVKQ